MLISFIADQITVIGNLKVYKHKYFQIYGFKLNNFYSLEVVGRKSETQLQVGENSKHITQND